jgi:STE24 endopeptidase
MPFLLLISLMLACLPIPWPAPPFGFSALQSTLATAGALLAVLLATALIAHRTTSRLATRPQRRAETLRRYDIARRLHFFATLGAFGLTLYSLGWGWTVQTVARVPRSDGPPALAPGAELLILLPFLIMQAGSWFLFYRVARALHESGSSPAEPFWGRWGYVLFHFRQNLILVYAPLFLFLIPQGVFRLYPQLENSAWAGIGSLALVPLFLLLMPLAMPALLGLRPLPAGPIRYRLEAHARRLGFRYRDILLWDTCRGIATAMVVGIVPRVRYVVFTDRLLHDLRDDEVDAVFGHEVGHIKHGHMLFYAFFLILSLLLMKALYEVVQLAEWVSLQRYGNLFMVAPVLFMGSYMLLVFGFLSRRCERQADLFGCRAGSCGNAACDGHDEHTTLAPRGTGLCRTGIRSFIHALERVEVLNDLSRDPPRWRGGSAREKLSFVFRLLTGWLATWQHSTIAKRIAFLHGVAADPAVAQRFQRRVWWVKWAIVLVLVGSLATLVAIWGWEVLFTLTSVEATSTAAAGLVPASLLSITARG